MNPLFIVLFATACVASPSNYGHHAYTTVNQGPGHTVVHQPSPQVSKQVHLGQTSYVANVHHQVIKPPTPHLPIAVPTVLKGTTSVNAPITKTVVEDHVVNQPVPVERRVEVPFDVPVYEERVHAIAQPVPVHRPVAVPVPTPVQGAPIVKVTQTAPIVHKTHTHTSSVGHSVPVAAYNAAPYAHGGIYGAAPYVNGGLYAGNGAAYGAYAHGAAYAHGYAHDAAYPAAHGYAGAYAHGYDHLETAY